MDGCTSAVCSNILGCKSVSELMIKRRITRNCTPLLGCFYLLYMFYSNLSPVYCC